MSNHPKKYQSTTWLLIKPWMIGLLIFLLLASFSSYIIYQRYNMLKKDEKQAAMNMAESVRHRLQQSLQYSLSATQAMALIIDKEGIPRNFDSVASFLLKNNKYIDGLQLVPGGIIRYVYPLEGNEAAVGYNILADSNRNKEAFKAIEKKELFFAGPFELRQGGRAVVGRLPIFINNKFWGFSAAIIRMPTLLQAAGIDTSGTTGYYFQLSKINPDTRKEEYYLPVTNGSLTTSEVVVPIPNGEWILSATPVNGYKSLQSIIPISLLGLILSVVGAIFATYLSKTPARLQKMVLQQTRELEKSDKRNKAIVNALPDMVFVLDREYRYIDYHHPIDQQPYVNADHFMSKKVYDILPEPLASEIVGFLEKVFTTGQMYSHSYTLQTDGEIRSYEARYVPHKKDDVLVLVRDTTQAKKAEQQIKESEEKYRTLVDQANDGIFIANFQGYFIVVNPAGCKLSGYTKEELLTMQLHDLTDAGELKTMPFQMQEIAAGKTASSERKLKRKNGELIDVEITAKIIAPDRFLSFVRDITERKKAEAAIKKSNERFNLIAIATNDIIWDWDLITGNMWWNDNFYKLFKLEKDLVKKDITSWYDGLHPDDLDKAKKSLHTSIEKKDITWSYEYRFLTSGGDIIEIFDRGYILYDDERRPYRMIGSMLDITERKKAELALKESEHRLKTILDTDPECIKLINRDVTLIDINSSGLAMIEADNAEQILGCSLSKVVAEKYQDKTTQLVKEAFEGKSAMLEFEMHTLKGKTRWCEILIVPFRNAGGEIIAALGVTRDMTNWKFAEEKLKTSFEEIRRLTDHLQNIREEERMHVAREIHDELGQQLTVLKMDVSRLGKKLAVTNEQDSTGINEILSSINKMVETVRKISSELRPGLLDDLGLVAALEWHGQDFMKRTGIKTSILSDITDDHFPKKISIGLFRIFQESLTNIARHAQAQQADVSLMWQGQQIVLLIEDDGKGFDPLSINDKKTLGIIGMKERAIMMGGTYNIFSNPGKGTIIEVIVPFSRQELKSPPAPFV